MRSVLVHPGFINKLRKDAALNELNKDSGVVVERKCVCGGEGGGGVGEDRTEKCGEEGVQVLVENRKVCVSVERGGGKIRIGPNSGGHVFKTVNHIKEAHLDS